MFRLFLFSICVPCFLSCQSDILFASSSSEEVPQVNQSLSPVEVPLPKKKSKLSLKKKSPQKDDIPVDLPSEYKEYIVTLKSPGKQMLDILVIVDSSKSMDPYLVKLGERLSSLLVSISDYDWQMAFTTADHGDHNSVKKDSTGKKGFHTQDQWQDHINDPLVSFGKLMPLEAKPVVVFEKDNLTTVMKGEMLNQRILTPQISDYQKVFLYTVSHFPQKYCESPPYCQGHLEQPLRVLKSSIQRVEHDNKALFRPGADFVSLIVTNEDERLGDQDQATSANDVIDTFNTLLKPLGKRFFAFNILVDEFCLKQDRLKSEAARLGRMIGELAIQTGGFNISICDEDYSKGLQNISKSIETFVEQSVDIEESFIPETLKVEFPDSDPIPWELVDKRLIFEEQPLEDIRVKISYKQPESAHL